MCEHAARVHPVKNKIIEACIGVSALYLGIEVSILWCVICM